VVLDAKVSLAFGPEPCYSKLSRGTCTWTIISKNTKQATLSYNDTNMVGKSAIEKYTCIGMIDQTERRV
jgi:pyrimidine deaminase RibD-like protein